jgi:hypothetical protein
MIDNADLITEIYERAIGERAILCKNFRWAVGMLVSVPPEKGSEKRSMKRLAADEAALVDSGYIPVFKDTFTRNCLHVLVRKAYGDEASILLTSSQKASDEIATWKIAISGRFSSSRNYYSEAEALVSALEAANE